MSDIIKSHEGRIKVIDRNGMRAFQDLLDGLKELFEDDEEAVINVKVSRFEARL